MVVLGARVARATAALQGGYYVITGVWPLVHLASFVAVTGPKQDLWLVQTVGALILVVGFTLLVEAFASARPSFAVHVLGVGSAVAFIAVDVVFYADGRIGAVYLLDALAEAFLLVGWTGAALLDARRTRAGAG